MPAHAVERSDPVDGDRGEGECKGARYEGRIDASGCQSPDSHWRRFDANAGATTSERRRTETRGHGMDRLVGVSRHPVAAPTMLCNRCPWAPRQ